MAETDLGRLVRGMRPRLLDQRLLFVTLPPGEPDPERVSTLVRVAEREGTTLVVPADVDLPEHARSAFPCARITLEVASALEAVGFLAVVTRALADAGIGVNPVAGFHHDHLFVGWDDRHRALAVLEELADGRSRGRGSVVVTDPVFDDDVPNVARIYDYILGGAHNFAADRERAHAILDACPSVGPTARANRGFLRHAVDHALDLGVRQFLDLGSGIPTVGNVHEIAHRRDPDARVAYVDHEPVAVAHSAAILADVPATTVVGADLRDPRAVLEAPGARDLVDLEQPIALLAMAVIHFVADTDDPAAILAGYRRHLAPGSLLAMTHGSDDYPDHPEFARAWREAAGLYGSTSNPLHQRSRAEIRTMITTAGFRPDGDDLVDVGRWGSPASADPLGFYAVITEPTR